MQDKILRRIFSEKIPIGSFTPDQCYHALQKTSKSSYIFDVLEDQNHITYLGFNPIAIFQSKDHKIEVITNGELKQYEGHPFEDLRQFIKNNTPTNLNSSHPEFANSIFGFVSYDAARLTNELSDHHPEMGEGKPDLSFTLFEIVIRFDHQNKLITFTVRAEDKQSASKKINDIKHLIHTPFSSSSSLSNKAKEIDVQTDMNDKTYREVLIKAKEHIRKGEVFQVVISRTFSLKTLANPFQIYTSLKTVNPSPFMFIYETPDFSIIGASPEKLVSVKNGVVEMAALGGSHPKDSSKSDLELGDALLHDEKEVAEHNMKMESCRNDIASLTTIGTLKTIELRGYRVFSHILHIISRFSGNLKKDLDCIDAICRALPSATITGAPKKQAMEIIDQYEVNHRGIYGGAMCLIDFKGNLISCLTIRTIILDHGIAYIRAGAGLVSNSDPDYEVNESIHKANAAIETLKRIKE